MPQPFLEQRGTRRFALTLPVAVRFQDAPVTEMPAHTKDVSARGVYFFLDAPVQPGAKMEFTMTLPPEITLTEQIRVRCVGKVVRIETQVNGKHGIAVAIEQYEFLGNSN